MPGEKLKFANSNANSAKKVSPMVAKDRRDNWYEVVYYYKGYYVAEPGKSKPDGSVEKRPKRRSEKPSK